MSVRRMLTATSFAAGLFALGIGVACAAPATPAPAVEPSAQDALARMGAYLRSQQALEVHVDTVREEVDDKDQKLQFLGSTVYKARKDPASLVVDIADDRRVRHFVYDGKSASMLAPRYNFYTTIPAPATIRGTLDLLSDKYDVVFPLEDLFLWGTNGPPRLAQERLSRRLRPHRRPGYRSICIPWRWNRLADLDCKR